MSICEECGNQETDMGCNACDPMCGLCNNKHPADRTQCEGCGDCLDQYGSCIWCDDDE